MVSVKGFSRRSGISGGGRLAPIATMISNISTGAGSGVDSHALAVKAAAALS